MLLRLSDHLAEQQCQEMAILIAAGLRELHSKSITVGLLNPWAIKFDKASSVYFDILWCVNKYVSQINIDAIDPRYAHYIGSSQLPSARSAPRRTDHQKFRLVDVRSHTL